MLKAPGMCWTDPCGCCPVPTCVLSRSLQMMHRFRITFTWSLRGFTCWFITAACHGSRHVSCAPLRLTVVTWPDDWCCLSLLQQSSLFCPSYDGVQFLWTNYPLGSKSTASCSVVSFCVFALAHACGRKGFTCNCHFPFTKNPGRGVWWSSWFAKYYCHRHSRKESSRVEIMVWATCAPQHILSASRHGNWMSSFTCRCGVGDVNLSLSLAICAKFALAITSLPRVHLDMWSHERTWLVKLYCLHFKL